MGPNVGVRATVGALVGNMVSESLDAARAPPTTADRSVTIFLKPRFLEMQSLRTFSIGRKCER